METIALAEGEVRYCVQQCQVAWLELELQQLSRLQSASRAGSTTPPRPLPRAQGRGPQRTVASPGMGSMGVAPVH